MKQYSIIFFLGMLISFFGSLPPGALNITATQMTAAKGQQAAIVFALGSAIAEALIVRLTLIGIKQIISRRRLFQILELLTAGLLLAMTIGCFIAAARMGGIASILPDYHLPPFVTGVLMTIINPLHIPFWLGWTSILINKQILSPLPVHYNWYIVGTGFGTFFGFLTFIFTGQFLIKAFESNQFIICLIIGFILLMGSILQIKKMIVSPVSVRFAKISNQIINKN